MPYSFGGNNYKQQQFLANALMQSSQNNASPLASGLGAFAGALLSGKAADTQENDNKQLADMLMGAKTPQERINIAMGSSDPSIQKAGMAALLSNKQEQPYSTVGKIQADLVAGRLTPEQAKAAMAKATTIAPTFGMMTPYQEANLGFRQDQSQWRKDEAEFRREQARQTRIDNGVRDFSDWADKSGFSELIGDVKRSNELLSPYVKDGKLSGDIPGYGETQWAPDFSISEEGRKIRQQVSTVKNAIIKARSGQAVSEQESNRLLDEIGEGQGKKIKDDAQLLRGIANVSNILNDRLQNIQAGYSPDIFDTYKKRGGNIGRVEPIIPSGQQKQPSPQARGGYYDKKIGNPNATIEQTLAEKAAQLPGENIPAGQSIQSSPMNISTQQQYDALPSGATYMEDGKMYRKP